MSLKRSTILGAVASVVMLASTLVALAAGEPGQWVTASSPHSVAETTKRLEEAIEKAGATLFATIDHQANASAAGLDLSPVTLVIFGNPNVGTPLMQANPAAGLDLPVRVLIWEEDGETRLGALAPDELKARYGLTEADEALAKMKGALDKLMAAASAE